MTIASEKQPLRVVLAAGGTGGHIMPALALAEALREEAPGIRVDFICGNRPVEIGVYSSAGVAPRPLPVGAMTAGGIGRRLRQTCDLCRGFVRAWRWMRDYDVAVGMGGYVAGPVLTAAWLRGVPVVLHDSNTILGRVNRWLAPRARVVACGLPLAQTPPGLRPERIREIGTPVRPRIGRAGRDEAARAFGLAANGFTILVTGGSLGGSHRYADLLAETVALLGKTWRAPNPLQVLWATGPHNLERVRAALRDRGFAAPAHLAAMIERMDLAYALADLVVSRAGGSTLAEILVCGLPSLLFPLPISAEGHQYSNADVLARRGAAIVREESQGDPRELAAEIASLAADPERLRLMGDAARSLARPDAARALARLVLESAKDRKTPGQTGGENGTRNAER